MNLLNALTDQQLCLLLEELNREVSSRICREAEEDPFVDGFTTDLANCAANLATVFDVEKDFRPSLVEEARDYYNGNIERARAA